MLQYVTLGVTLAIVTVTLVNGVYGNIWKPYECFSDPFLESCVQDTRIDCHQIFNGSDTDFCADAVGSGGGSGSGLWKENGAYLQANETATTASAVNATKLLLESLTTSNDVLLLKASDGSRLARITETAGGASYVEFDDSSGNAKTLLRADGGDSYHTNGQFGYNTSKPNSTVDIVGNLTVYNTFSTLYLPQSSNGKTLIEYWGNQNGVQIVNSGTGTSNNALNVVSNNTEDTTLGVNGVETDRGTVKIVHDGNGTDGGASAISIVLNGTGTASQGIYVLNDYNTTGDLMTFTKGEVSSFVLESTGSLILSNNDDQGFLVQREDGQDIFRVSSISDVVFTGKMIPRAEATYDLGDMEHTFLDFYLTRSIIFNDTSTTASISYDNSSTRFNISANTLFEENVTIQHNLTMMSSNTTHPIGSFSFRAGDMSVNRSYTLPTSAPGSEGEQLLRCDEDYVCDWYAYTVPTDPVIFSTINTEYGTNPVADTSTDTVIMKSDDNSIIVEGNAVTDTVKFRINESTGHNWTNYSNHIGENTLRWVGSTGDIYFSEYLGSFPGIFGTNGIFFSNAYATSYVWVSNPGITYIQGINGIYSTSSHTFNSNILVGGFSTFENNATFENTTTFEDDIILEDTLRVDNACGIASSTNTYEMRTAITNTSMSIGTDVLDGVPELCPGNVTGIIGYCENCDPGVNEISMELRINNVSQTCDVPQLTTEDDVDGVSCDVSFNALDKIGCWTKTETGAVTGILCKIYIRYD